MPLALSALAALVLLLGASAVASATIPSQHPPPAAVVLHLSDLHLSTNVAKYWEAFGDREGDLALFARQLLPLLAPRAAVLSGDLTDSKDASGAGVQQGPEWQAYRRTLDAFVAAGVPEDSILDVRGNHDAFNMPVRGGPNDFFAQYGAEGLRSPPVQRVFSRLLPASGGSGGADPAPAAAAVAAAGEGACPAAALLGIDASPEPGLRSPANFAGVVTPTLMADVAAELGAIVARLPPGCPRPPVVAYGHYPLSTVDAPAGMAGVRGLVSHLARSVHSMQGLAQLLADHNVSAYLSGHLHAAFGQRLHRMHPTRAGGYLAELETAAWKDDRRLRLLALDTGALSFADLFFHAPGSPRRPRRADAAATRTAAWQAGYERRGYGVSSVDPSAQVIDHIVLVTWPPDARYSPLAPGSPGSAAAEAGTAAAAAAAAAAKAAAEGLRGHSGGIGGVIGVMGRELRGGGPGTPVGSSVEEEEAQSGSGSSDGGGGAEGGIEVGGSSGVGDGVMEPGLVRAVVFPVDGQAAAAPEAWQVSLRSWLPRGAPFAPDQPMELLLPSTAPSGSHAAAGGRAFLGTLAANLSCGSAATHVYIQVVVAGQGSSKESSASPEQPVGLRCAPLPGPGGRGCARLRCVPAPASGEPLPLGVSWLERFVLAVNGPVLVHRLFILLWACHVGFLLLLPRLLRPSLAPRILGAPLFRPAAGSSCEPALGVASGGAAGAALAKAAGWTRAARRAVAGAVLWPPAALVLLANEPAVWSAVVAYCLYLIAGPWYAAQLLTGGYPGGTALVFHLGVLVRLPALVPAHDSGTGAPPPPEQGAGAAWRFVGTADVMFITLVHLVLCILPLTLWLACVVGTRQLAGTAGTAAHPATSGCSDSRTGSRPGSASRPLGGASAAEDDAGGGGRSGNDAGAAAAGDASGAKRRGSGGLGLGGLFTLPQWLALAALVGVYGIGTWDKVAKLNGGIAVALSPGLAWTIPLAVLLAAWRRLPAPTAACLGKRD